MSLIQHKAPVVFAKISDDVLLLAQHKGLSSARFVERDGQKLWRDGGSYQFAITCDGHEVIGGLLNLTSFDGAARVFAFALDMLAKKVRDGSREQQVLTRKAQIATEDVL